MFEILKNTYTLGMALLTGTDVSPERLKKRLEVCSTCDKVEKDGEGLMRCTICTCKLKEKGLINLARYEETRNYGCHYPGGSKWKKNEC